MPNMARKWHEHAKHLVVPHAGNNFRPKILTGTAVLAVLTLALLIEGAYLFATKTPDGRTSLLATVLPAALIDLTNADRAEAGAGELTENALLTQAAQLKATDMAQKGYFAHVTPEGYQPWHWLDEAGYDYRYAGENLAVNFEDSKDVEEAWMKSPTHHANIVKPQYEEIGIATAEGEYKGKRVTFVVQFFASPEIAVVTPEPVAAEPDTSVAQAPRAEEPAVATETAVLGEETVTPVSVVEDTIVQAAASPNHTATAALSILALIVGFMFLVALFSHIKMPYLEALSGTFAVLLIVIGLLAFNSSRMPSLEVPEDASAAAVLAF